MAETTKANRQNTKSTMFGLFKSSVRNKVPVEVFMQSLGKVVATRKRQTLATLKNVMTAVRGQARAVLATGQSGRYFNVGVLDSSQTTVCARYIGMSWPAPYSAIENKPPRTPPVHNCRSMIVFRKDGDPEPDETPFMDQFNASEELQLNLLGKTRFDAMKRGDLRITSFAQYERSVLTTLDEMGLK